MGMGMGMGLGETGGRNGNGEFLRGGQRFRDEQGVKDFELLGRSGRGPVNQVMESNMVALASSSRLINTISLPLPNMFKAAS